MLSYCKFGTRRGCLWLLCSHGDPAGVPPFYTGEPW